MSLVSLPCATPCFDPRVILNISISRCWVSSPADCVSLQAATSAPLIERSIERATGIVYNITGGRDLTLQEVNRVSEVVTGLADPSANVIFGAVIDEQYDGEIHVTIIATGFSQTFEENLLSGKAVVRALQSWCISRFMMAKLPP